MESPNSGRHRNNNSKCNRKSTQANVNQSVNLKEHQISKSETSTNPDDASQPAILTSSDSENLTSETSSSRQVLCHNKDAEPSGTLKEQPQEEIGPGVWISGKEPTRKLSDHDHTDACVVGETTITKLLSLESKLESPRLSPEKKGTSRTLVTSTEKDNERKTLSQGEGISKQWKPGNKRLSVDYLCGICKKSFTSSRTLKRHMRSHSDSPQIDPYVCPICNETFKHQRAHSSHIKCHRAEGTLVFSCRTCSATYLTEDDLDSHQGACTGKKRYPCPSCQSAFRSPGELNSHMLSHAGVKPFQCDNCGKTFTRLQMLREHSRLHTGERPYQCKLCPETFTFRAGLERHTKTHTGVKPYKCSFCSAAFSQATYLKDHIRTHTGEKPYLCPICGQRCAQAGNLRTHLRTHTNVRPFHCTTCGAGFKRQEVLQRHLRSHTGERPYSCTICGATYPDGKALKLHSWSHTGELPFKCDTCGKGFKEKKCLHSHLRVHTGEKPHRCPICNKAFAFQRYIQRHLAVHKKKTELCEEADGASDMIHRAKHRKSSSASISNNNRSMNADLANPTFGSNSSTIIGSQEQVKGEETNINTNSVPVNHMACVKITELKPNKDVRSDTWHSGSSQSGDILQQLQPCDPVRLCVQTTTPETRGVLTPSRGCCPTSPSRAESIENTIKAPSNTSSNFDLNGEPVYAIAGPKELLKQFTFKTAFTGVEPLVSVSACSGPLPGQTVPMTLSEASVALSRADVSILSTAEPSSGPGFSLSGPDTGLSHRGTTFSVLTDPLSESLDAFSGMVFTSSDPRVSASVSYDIDTRVVRPQTSLWCPSSQLLMPSPSLLNTVKPDSQKPATTSAGSLSLGHFQSQPIDLHSGVNKAQSNSVSQVLGAHVSESELTASLHHFGHRDDDMDLLPVSPQFIGHTRFPWPTSGGVLPPPPVGGASYSSLQPVPLPVTAEGLTSGEDSGVTSTLLLVTPRTLESVTLTRPLEEPLLQPATPTLEVPNPGM